MAKFLKPLLGACQIIFALFLVYFALHLARYHLAIVTFPFSDAFREGAMMTSTDALVKGLNPFNMSLQPQLMNQYGIIYPLLVWPFAKLFGTTIIIHRMVTAFFILASCILVFCVLRRMSVSILLNIWAVLMLYASLTFPGTSTPSIDPGATGMFFMLLTVFIPWFCGYSYKSLIVSMLFGALAFYTKPYALLGAPVMLSYLFLFVSRKKSVFYGFLLLILSVISIMVVNHLLPAYFDNCFFTSLYMAPAWSSMERLHMQINWYSSLHQWTLILMGALFIWYGFKNIKRIPSLLKNAIHHEITFVVYAGLCSAFVLYASLGRHTGATLWYFFQLLSPFLLIGAAWLFNRYPLWPLVCAPFLLLNLHTMTADQDLKRFDKNPLEWEEVSLLVSQNHLILNSSLIAPLLIEQKKEVFDNGQTEYFLAGGKRSPWVKKFFKEDDRVFVQLMVFFSNIRTMVEDKKFDLIMLQPNLLPLGVADDIRKYYKYEGQLVVYAPQDKRPYALSVWKPL